MSLHRPFHYVKEEGAMPRFSANLSMLFCEHPFLERFKAARDAGFEAVEYMFPYDHPPERLGELLEEHGLKQVLFNLPAGDWQAGERGIAVDPRRVEEFREGVEHALQYARILHVPRINCLVGKEAAGFDREEQWRILVENLRFAARMLAKEGITLLVEPLNSVDVPGFFLTSTREALRLLEEVSEENLKIQYDVYHMQKMEGDLTATLRENLNRVGHIQIADNPGRHQPGTGEINYAFLLRELDRMGYEGHVGLEYVPEPDTRSSLRWIEEMGFAEGLTEPLKKA